MSIINLLSDNKLDIISENLIVKDQATITNMKSDKILDFFDSSGSNGQVITSTGPSWTWQDIDIHNKSYLQYGYELNENSNNDTQLPLNITNIYNPLRRNFSSPAAYDIKLNQGFTIDSGYRFQPINSGKYLVTGSVSISAPADTGIITLAIEEVPGVGPNIVSPVSYKSNVGQPEVTTMDFSIIIEADNTKLYNFIIKQSNVAAQTLYIHLLNISISQL